MAYSDCPTEVAKDAVDDVFRESVIMVDDVEGFAKDMWSREFAAFHSYVVFKANRARAWAGRHICRGPGSGLLRQ